ncbi:MAG: hypothetical protein GX448_08520 [Planctomycetes bacterium]|nr:hypothetical protein [Planctomycetota bacterium]
MLVIREPIMWRIVDHTGGRLRAALEREWGEGVSSNALELPHNFGAATDIAEELRWLGFDSQKDFNVRPVEDVIVASLLISSCV